MNKRIVKQTVAAALLTSSILSFAPVTYGKEMTIQQSIDAVKLEMKKAPLYYVEPAYESTIEPSKELYPVLNNVKKHYKELKQKIQSSNLSTKEKKDKIKELDSLYEEKITKGVIPYIDAYNYAVKYLDPILKEMLDAHAAGDLDGVEQAYHKLSYQLDSRTSILYRFTGKAPRDLLLEKYKKPSDAKRDELRIPVTIYMKNNEVLKLWNEGKKEEARKVMDEVLTLISKAPTDGKTNYSNLLSKEVKEAEALFSNKPTPPPTPVVPSNPSVGGGDNEGPSESAEERRLRVAKSNAIEELRNYKVTVKNDYSTVNWNTIQTLITTWTSMINATPTQAAVAQVLIDAKAAIDQIKTIELEALDAAKNQTLVELTNYKENVKDDYSTENWEAIETLKNTWTSTINVAPTQAAVAQVLIDAKAAIDQIKTIEVEALDAAKNQALVELTNYKENVKDDYSTDNWEAIETLKNTWTSTINAATTQAEVAQVLIGAKNAIDIIQTNNQAPTVVNAIGNQNGIVGNLIFVDLASVFADANNDSLTITADKGSVFGTMWSYIPSLADKGVVTVTLTASDGKGGAVEEVFNLTVVEQLIAAISLPNQGINDMSPVVVTFNKPLAPSTLEITNINDLLGDYPILLAWYSPSTRGNYPVHSFSWDNTNPNEPKLIIISNHSYRTIRMDTQKFELNFKQNVVKTTDSDIYNKAELFLLP